MGTTTCLLSTPAKPALTSQTQLYSQLQKIKINQTSHFNLVQKKPKSSSPTRISATLKSPRGFGAPPPRRSKKSKRGISNEEDEDDDDENDDDERSEDQGIIPEIVTNRMMNRMAFTVGTPLFIGLLFFPFFYYLKVGLKIDVPTWVPFIVSFIFFGSALLGVSYGIVSSSWDPLREGSLLGWNEAKKNWPVFWQSLRGGGKSDK